MSDQIKYLVEYEDRDCFHEVYDTLDEANSEAEDKWNNLSKWDKKRSHVYVIEVNKDDLEDELWSSYTDYKDGLAFFDSDKIESICVNYEGGESRYNPGEGVDYMIAMFDQFGENYLSQTPNSFHPITELYSERVNPTWNEEDEAFEDEDYCYDALKEDIIEQAESNGVHPSRLSFLYD